MRVITTVDCWFKQLSILNNNKRDLIASFGNLNESSVVGSYNLASMRKKNS